MWDKKRQAAWILGGLIIGTYISYSDAITDDGVFSWKFFLFMETLVILIMGTLFYVYSRKKS
jgi:hypothetical protein